MNEEKTLSACARVPLVNSRWVDVFVRDIIPLRAGRSYRHDFYAFGSTSNNQSVAVKITSFRPFFFVSLPPDLDVSKLEEWKKSLNEDETVNRFSYTNFSCVTEIEIVRKRLLIGFRHDNTQLVLKLTYNNPLQLKSLVKLFESGPVSYFAEKSMTKKKYAFTCYNTKWPTESLLMHACGVQLNTWMRFSGYVREPPARAVTNCHHELRSDFRRITPSPNQKTPNPSMVAGLRLLARSSLSSEMVPIAQNGDPVVSIALCLYRMNAPECKSLVVLTTAECGSEANLLMKFSALLVEYQVDIMMYFADNLNCIEYLAVRAKAWNVPLALSRLKDTAFHLYQPAGSTRTVIVSHPGRDRFDIVDVLKKNVKYPLDDYTLSTALSHPKLLKSSPPVALLEQQFLTNGPTELTLELEWMVLLAESNNMVINFSVFSKETYCNLTDVVRRGQQVRVFRRCLANFHQANIIINREQLQQPPVIISCPDTESDYPPAPEVRNEPFNNKRRKILGLSYDADQVRISRKRKKLASKSQRQDKQAQADLFGNTILTKKQKVAEKQEAARAKAASLKQFTGGAVAKPHAGFYFMKDERIATKDFASLYPSVNVSERFCYSNVLFNRALLTDPNVKCLKVPINPRECAVFISHVRNPHTGKFEPVSTIMPEIVAEIMLIRKRAKKAMKAAPEGSFERSVLDSLQLTCKVLQNAVYGFYSVEKNAVLALAILSASICAVGRWMIGKAKYLCITKFDAFVCYGDTDSLMLSVPLPPEVAKTADENAIMKYYFDIYFRMEKYFDTVFKPPHKFEFEALKYPFWMSEKKKNYGAKVYPALKGWVNQAAEIDVKGLMFTKRCTGRLLLKTGHGVMDRILNLKHKELHEYISRQLQKIITGEASYDDLCVTCNIKDTKEYLTDSLVQLTVVKDIQRRTGRVVLAGTRISYVYRRSPAGNNGQNVKDFELGVETKYAKSSKIPLNKVYYVRQFENTIIKPLLVFHPKSREAIAVTLRQCQSAAFIENERTVALV